MEIRELSARHGGEWACRVEAEGGANSKPRPSEVAEGGDAPVKPNKIDATVSRIKDETLSPINHPFIKDTFVKVNSEDLGEPKSKSLSIYVIHRNTKYCPVNGEIFL